MTTIFFSSKNISSKNSCHFALINITYLLFFQFEVNHVWNSQMQQTNVDHHNIIFLTESDLFEFWHHIYFGIFFYSLGWASLCSTTEVMLLLVRHVLVTTLENFHRKALNFCVYHTLPFGSYPRFLPTGCIL